MTQKNNKKAKKKINSSQDIEKTELSSEKFLKVSAMATGEDEVCFKSKSEKILKRLEDKLEQVNKKIDDSLKLQEFNYNKICEKLKVQEVKASESNEKVEKIVKKTS